MYRDRRDISDRLHIPDLAEELILGIDMIRILRKERQEIKFLCRELRFLAVDPDAPCRLVNFQTADLDDVVLVQSLSYLDRCAFTRATSSLGENGFVM